MGKVTRVDGLEMFAKFHPHEMDTSDMLLPCPFCGSPGAFTDGNRRGMTPNHFTVSAACSNTSCGVRTPEHYATREAAAKAWNRRESSG